MNINWDEKPEWADVWIEDTLVDRFSGWHAELPDRFIDEGGQHYFKSVTQKIKIHYPPETKPEWDGTGLPPVGTVCEMNHPGIDDWEPVKIKAFFDDCVVIQGSERIWIDGYSITYIDKELLFRPIKSDREKWVDKALEALSKNPTAMPKEFMGMIYDALLLGELPMPKGDK